MTWARGENGADVVTGLRGVERSGQHEGEGGNARRADCEDPHPEADIAVLVHEVFDGPKRAEPPQTRRQAQKPATGKPDERDNHRIGNAFQHR